MTRSISYTLFLHRALDRTIRAEAARTGLSRAAVVRIILWTHFVAQKNFMAQQKGAAS